ncbi:hypothetical protein FLONG3_6771 [Fusarium longipes]|uniref:Uncharacterized protein n=1 Tax=Fusarium longipes TaxID=694270 RepID=A0A395SJL3_9HYPO|nr:hypothetical protein FLONG3_6771 [Fusarium longipes]
MAHPTEPSSLLADFSCQENDRHSHEDKHTSVTEISLESGPKNEERVFKRKFMPGRLLADSAATTIPVALVVFAVFMIRLDNKETDQEEYEKWKNAINIIASVFPIAFASIVGRMVYEAARWKLEKGATLGILEQLIGSRTVGSTFTTQVSLGRFNILGLVLLLLWAFSPLGSQAVLRALNSKLESLNSTSSVVYFSTDAETQLASPIVFTRERSSPEARIMGQIKTMFVALFFTSEARKIDSLDLWGNLKIPNLNIQDDMWHDVPSEPSPDSYSALLGIPITNVSPGNLTFSLESSYLYLECGVLRRKSGGLWPSLNWTDNLSYGSGRPRANNTWYGRNSSELQSSWTMAVDRFVDPYWSNNRKIAYRLGQPSNDVYFANPRLLKNETGLNVTPANLLFVAMFQDERYTVPTSFETECIVMQRYVESRVHCSRVDESTPQNCSVTAQRLSKTNHATENATMLSWENVWAYVSSMPALLGGTKEFADITMQYLNNPRLNAITGKDIDADKDLFLSLGPEEFGRRLGQVINSYLLLGQVYKTAMHADSKFNYSVTVPAEVSNLVEVYTVNWLWTSLFLASSVILWASGIVSVVFAHLAIGPEILGYASSVVRDSKYIDLPSEAGRKEAFDVVKMVGQKRLRYGFIDSATGYSQPSVGVGLESETGDIHKR